MEKQNQAVLEIVKNMEDKYENITTFSQLQEKEIEKIINKKMKTMEAKYNKIIENKLKLIESNSKAKEKIQENKNNKNDINNANLCLIKTPPKINNNL